MKSKRNLFCKERHRIKDEVERKIVLFSNKHIKYIMNRVKKGETISGIIQKLLDDKINQEIINDKKEKRKKDGVKHNKPPIYVKQLQTRLTYEEWEWLKNKSKENNTHMSVLVRCGIDNMIFMEQYNNEINKWR